MAPLVEETQDTKKRKNFKKSADIFAVERFFGFCSKNNKQNYEKNSRRKKKPPPLNSSQVDNVRRAISRIAIGFLHPLPPFLSLSLFFSVFLFRAVFVVLFPH